MTENGRDIYIFADVSNHLENLSRISLISLVSMSDCTFALVTNTFLVESYKERSVSLGGDERRIVGIHIAMCDLQLSLARNTAQGGYVAALTFIWMKVSNGGSSNTRRRKRYSAFQWKGHLQSDQDTSSGAVAPDP